MKHFISPKLDAAFNARLLTQEQFEEWFPDLGELPSTAFQTEVIAPHIDEDLTLMSGHELYQRAIHLPAGDPRIMAYVRQAQALYSKARRHWPEWQAALGDE